jgi:hypothetical protein
MGAAITIRWGQEVSRDARRAVRCDTGDNRRGNDGSPQRPRPRLACAAGPSSDWAAGERDANTTGRLPEPGAGPLTRRPPHVY